MELKVRAELLIEDYRIDVHDANLHLHRHEFE